MQIASAKNLGVYLICSSALLDCSSSFVSVLLHLIGVKNISKFPVDLLPRFVVIKRTVFNFLFMGKGGKDGLWLILVHCNTNNISFPQYDNDIYTTQK